jgi:hypothetical protein
LELGKLGDKISDELMEGISDVKDVDLQKAKELVQKLPNIPKYD